MNPVSMNRFKNGIYFVAVVLAAGSAYVIGSRAYQASANVQTRLEVAQAALAKGEGAMALKLFQPLAKNGNAEAAFWVADIYAHGIGLPRDETKAIAYLKQSANGGYVMAEAKLGRLYADGERTVQDFGAADNWLSKAAMKGNAASERDLGRLYEKGFGVPRDLAKAYAWYENAVLRGDAEAHRLRDRVVAQLPPKDLTQAEALAQKLNGEIGPVA